MSFKTLSLATVALLASTGLAIALPEPAAALQARAGDVGFFVAYPQPNFKGANVTLAVGQPGQVFCQIYGDVDKKNARYPAIQSYTATNIGCFTFPTTNCSGDANGFIGNGAKPSVNINVGSVVCGFQASS